MILARFKRESRDHDTQEVQVADFELVIAPDGPFCWQIFERKVGKDSRMKVSYPGNLERAVKSAAERLALHQADLIGDGTIGELIDSLNRLKDEISKKISRESNPKGEPSPVKKIKKIKKVIKVAKIVEE